MKKVPPEELFGKTYEYLTVIGYNPVSDKLICKCKCGNTHELIRFNFGRTKSCGCLKPSNNLNYKHGDTGTRLHSIWLAMKRRAVSKTDNKKNYGNRGISMCSEWANDYLVFKAWALANGYADNLSIDRIDVNGDYEPQNCRWLTFKEQQNNKRTNHFLTFRGKTQTIAQWAEEIGMNYQTLSRRINVAKMNPEEALTKPVDIKMRNKLTKRESKEHE